MTMDLERLEIINRITRLEERLANVRFGRWYFPPSDGQVLTYNAEHFNFVPAYGDDGTTPVVGAGTLRLIEKKVLTAAAATVTFSDIPSTYEELRLFCHVRSDRVGQDYDVMYARMNGDSGANYDRYSTRHSTATVSSYAIGATYAHIGRLEGSTARANTFAAPAIRLPGYSLTDREKWILVPVYGAFGDLGASGDLNMVHSANRWRSTAAITSILLYLYSASKFVSGCRFLLYGIV